VMGATFEATIQKLTEQMKPAKGQVWDSFEHRAADALVQLCEQPDTKDEAPTLAPRPVVQTLIPLSGPAEIAGIPIADSLLEQLRANASIEPVLVDDDGVPVAVGKRFTVVSPKLVRAVLLRDGQCRYGTCERRSGLQVHHLQPGSWGGSDDIANLAAVCRPHHRLLVPHGDRVLIGNPHQPDGLRLLTLADLTPEHRQQLGLPPPGAGPAP
jgi:HNH endonuclease